MDLSTAERRFRELWGDIRDLISVGDLLEWDQETQMPAGGVESRAKMVATLEGLKHRALNAPELHEALDTCAESAPEGSLLAAQVRSARLDVDRAVKVPASLTREIAEARVGGLETWRRAREAADFDLFAGHLEKLVELRRQEAAALDPGGNAYDAMLHLFEPGAKEADLEPLFADLREKLTPLVQAVIERAPQVDETPAAGDFPADRQHAFCRRLATAIGFDFDSGRLDLSTHPFCIGIARQDVRMTWRYDPRDFRSAVFGVLHESGHGLYEQGLPADQRGMPVGDAVSLGVHESQSRLWENHVGRSRGFWSWALPHYREAFPDAPEVDVDRMWPLLHTVRPSFIRVEADEATYNLHIAVRFEIERALLARKLEVRDLPEAWDDLYEQLLGIRPENAADGVLQDIHWAQGMFGYFPTYTLGTMAAAQLFAAAGRDLGDLEAMFAAGEFQPLLDWLRENVHRHGSRWQAPELIERATGSPLAADDLLAYLRQTTEEVYGVSE
ncbi:MAG: carboxypeptidase M32 [bacterium]|nr:carboxypeptidase M32 [bacterium]